MAGFEETINQMEVDSKDNVDKVFDVIEDASPEEIAALREISEEDKNEVPDSPDETPDKEEGKGEAKPLTDKTQEAKPEGSQESKVEVAGQEPKAPVEKINKIVEITDEYINQAEEKDRTILKGLKGSKLDEKSLGILINSQRKLGEQGLELGELRKKVQSPQPTEIQKAIPEQIPQQNLNEDLEVYKETEIYNRLRAKYPGLPVDKNELKEYVDDMPRDDYEDYRELKKSISKAVESDINKALYIEKNYGRINETIVNNEIIHITNELKESGIEDPASLGFDFSITEDANGRKSNALLAQLMLKDGQLDPEVVSYYGQRAILNENALTRKFFDINRKAIIKAVTEKAKIQAARDTHEAATNAQDAALNTIAKPKSTANSSVKDKITSGQMPDINDIDNLEYDQVKAARKLLGSREA